MWFNYVHGDRLKSQWFMFLMTVDWLNESYDQLSMQGHGMQLLGKLVDIEVCI